MRGEFVPVWVVGALAVLVGMGIYLYDLGTKAPSPDPERYLLGAPSDCSTPGICEEGQNPTLEPYSTASICGELILNIIEQGDTLYPSDIFEEWIEDKLDDPRYPQHRILACVVDLIMVLPWLAPQGERHPL